MSSTATSHQSPRRSTRIRAQIPLRVSSLDPSFPFSERCYTVVINTEGCGVRLASPLEPGLAISLDDLPGGKTRTARVANCVALGTEGKYWLVGLALDEPGQNIWCLHPAPADWESAPHPVAAIPAPKKTNEWPYSVFSSRGEAHPGRK